MILHARNLLFEVYAYVDLPVLSLENLCCTRLQRRWGLLRSYRRTCKHILGRFCLSHRSVKLSFFVIGGNFIGILHTWFTDGLRPDFKRTRCLNLPGLTRGSMYIDSFLRSLHFWNRFNRKEPEERNLESTDRISNLTRVSEVLVNKIWKWYRSASASFNRLRSARVSPRYCDSSTLACTSDWQQLSKQRVG